MAIHTTAQSSSKWRVFFSRFSTTASSIERFPTVHSPSNNLLLSAIHSLPHDPPEIGEKMSDVLNQMIENSGKILEANVGEMSYAPASLEVAYGWFGDWIDKETMDKLFAFPHMGTYVIVRQTGARVFEPMPIYARVGMHLIFVNLSGILEWSWVESIFRNASIKQGKIYDSTDPKFVQAHIHSFIKTYNIDTSELLEQDLTKYPTFNSFFYRRLVPSARPPASPQDLSVITSVADSRLSVFEDISMAKKFWIKSRKFSIPALLDMSPASVIRLFGKRPSLAIFRLAPQDYHRYASPVDAILSKLMLIAGTYYTVIREPAGNNLCAVNEDINVFAGNRRDVLLLSSRISASPTAGNDSPLTTLAFVAIGALLVGSIGWSKKPGESIKKGEDLGWFAYGGSTVALVFPQGTVKWDDDLLKASKGEWRGEYGAEELKAMETLEAAKEMEPMVKKRGTFGTEVFVRLGEKIGTVVGT